VRERKYRKFCETLRDTTLTEREFKAQFGFELTEARTLVGFDQAKFRKLEELQRKQEGLADAKNQGAKEKAAYVKATETLEAFQEEMADDLRRTTDQNKTRLQEVFQMSKARVFRSCLQKLVDEVRGSQIYVDKSGIPTIRKKAKSSLRKIGL